jgi:hypothetical protein
LPSAVLLLMFQFLRFNTHKYGVAWYIVFSEFRLNTITVLSNDVALHLKYLLTSLNTLLIKLHLQIIFQKFDTSVYSEIPLEGYYYIIQFSM